MRSPHHTLLLTLVFVGLAGCAPIRTQVESVSPAANSVVTLEGFSTVTTIEVVFDHRMDLTSITGDNFIVTGSVSGVILGAITGVGENRTVTFTPLLPLLVDESIIYKRHNFSF
jgi:hypothetical protein